MVRRMDLDPPEAMFTRQMVRDVIPGLFTVGDGFLLVDGQTWRVVKMDDEAFYCVLDDRGVTTE